MKAFIVFAAVACVASAGLIPATTIVRAPAFDSAVIKSDRIGGNFAYSTAENHAYAAVSPVVQHVATPVAVSYSAPAFYHHTPLAFAAPSLVAHTPISPLVFSGVPAPLASAVETAPVVEDAAPSASAPAESAAVAPEAPAAESAPAPAAPETPASDDTVAVEAA